jgi:hypothetical protein
VDGVDTLAAGVVDDSQGASLLGQKAKVVALVSHTVEAL